ncbi:hypothetical protein V2P20_14095 [Methylobacter sp. Wu1]|uniref:hypothetical protein n=1 Tax=Methylobacter sp. Wu1 TaxID=3119359 RepID=UPI002F956309
MLYNNIGKHTIKSVKDAGKIIVLEDNSKWEVYSLDKFTSKIWGFADRVTIKPDIGSKFRIERMARSGKVEKVRATLLN